MFTNFAGVLMLVSHFLVTLLLWANAAITDQEHVGSSTFIAAFSTTLWVLALIAMVRSARKASVDQKN